MIKNTGVIINQCVSLLSGTTCSVQNDWKKLVMCAEEVCQMAVHMYQYTAGRVAVVYRWCTGGVPVQFIIK